MRRDLRTRIALIAGLLVLLATHAVIAQKETLLANGRVVLLELAPVDPRSLIQGDYMALQFRLADDLLAVEHVRADAAGNGDGRLVLRNDVDGIARLVRRDDGRALQPGEFLLRYRIRHGSVKFATNAYFFQEGTAERHAAARYGAFRVDDNGDAILTGLR